MDAGAPDAGPEIETSCTDEIDNDGDGLIDCEDDDCGELPLCTPEDDCDDGRDNDADGWTDCADPDCVGAPTCNPEMDCTNGIDDDGDGFADCRDFDCDGVGFCEFAGEMSCQDGEDNDADGLTDCEDTSCAGGPECVLGCPAGSTPVTYVAADVPVPIESEAVQSSSMTADGDGIVASVALQVGVTHTYVGDLVLTLVGPAGQRILLADRVGSGGDNFSATLFADAAPTPITSGSPPFSGAFQPEEPLDALIGAPEAGTWTFEVSDEAAGDDGAIEAVALYLCVCTDCEVGAACQDGEDNDMDGDTDCDDADCAGVIQCMPETICDDGLDDDQDGAIDCEDAECDGVGICEYAAELTCDDGADNDADGDIDCADSDCSADAACLPEADCSDGEDNDMDGLTDCADPGCDGVGVCEVGQELSCGDGEDNDGDGLTDCADADCAGGPSCVIACPAGSSLATYAAADVPVAIESQAVQSSSITVGGGGVVARAGLQIDIVHTFDGDLVLTLVGPAGQRVLLADRLGSSGDNYTDTLFADAAPTPITSGSPPFSGAFQPEEPLDALIGAPEAGTWTFEVSDEAAGDDGAIEAVQLHLCVCTECELGAACQDGEDNDMDGDTDCDDTDCAGLIQCTPETVCDDGVDDDQDGAIDCEDAECDGVGICEYDTELTCDDGADNDADGDIDCADLDCSGLALCAPEADCTDGVDNDADGATDCADPGCDGIDFCEFGEELSCSDGEDNDGDGMTDCDDPSCADLLGCLYTCGPGDDMVAASATDLPQAITDLSTVTSIVELAGAGTVSGVIVRFNATHTFDGDLDVTLRSPAGTTVDLTSDNGSTGENYTDTIFLDAAATAITDGSAPFTGEFQPEQPLSTFDGESFEGSWSLDVHDDASGDQGSFTGFDLAVCVTP